MQNASNCSAVLLEVLLHVQYPSLLKVHAQCAQGAFIETLACGCKAVQTNNTGDIIRHWWLCCYCHNITRSGSPPVFYECTSFNPIWKSVHNKTRIALIDYIRYNLYNYNEYLLDLCPLQPLSWSGQLLTLHPTTAPALSLSLSLSLSLQKTSRRKKSTGCKHRCITRFPLPVYSQHLASLQEEHYHIHYTTSGFPPLPWT